MNLSPNDYWNILKVHKNRILRTIAICCAISLSLFFVLPKKYKVSATISVQTQYFQLPLVSSFLPETHDPQELRSKREALIRQALSQKFLSDIARKHRLLKEADLEPINNHEISLLSKRFEIIPNGPSGFVINFTAKTPQLAYQVLTEFLTHLQNLMIIDRRLTLLNLHDAIQEQLESLSVGDSPETANAILAARPDLAKRRIKKIENEIETLKNAYSERHPRIAALNAQLRNLAQFDKPWNDANTIPQRDDLFSGTRVDPASKELFDDLLRKYRYIDIVLYMDQQSKDHYMSYLQEPFLPSSPTWPKIPILLVWGIAAGFLIGAGSALLRKNPKPDTIAVPGEIPAGLTPRPLPIARVDGTAYDNA